VDLLSTNRSDYVARCNTCLVGWSASLDTRHHGGVARSGRELNAKECAV
jgi:hypothetical protein